MQIRPLHPLFAAEVTGLDLAVPPPAALLEALHDAFLDHAVLLIRGQGLSGEAQAELTRRLAALEAERLLARSLLDPPALRVSLGDGPGDGGAGAAWHADHTHDAEPSLACLAYAAATGGAIRFADQRAALAALPPSLRTRAEGLRAEHRGPTGPAEHPVVRRHPITDEAALFVNPGFTRRVLNLPQAESAALLGTLFAAATAPAVGFAHECRVGDLLVWDNRAVLHTGGAGGALRRTRIGGDRPAAAHALDMPWVVAG